MESESTPISQSTIEGLRALLIKLETDHSRDLERIAETYRDNRASVLKTIELMESVQIVDDDVHVMAQKIAARIRPPQRENLNGYGAIARIVRNAVLSMEGEFTRQDVHKKLMEINPVIAERVNGSLASHLWRFNTKEQIIRVTQKGSAHEQSKYVKV